MARSIRYPIDDAGFVRQCAWCRRVADEHGRYRLIAAVLIQGASHGCCEACAIRFLGGRFSVAVPTLNRA